MNNVERPSQVRNATILMTLGGIILIYTGIQFYYYSIISAILVSPLFGILQITFGIFSICASFPIWLQKVWAAKLIIGIGIAVCGTFVIFGFYLIIIFFALWYYAVLDYIKKGLPSKPSD